MNRAMMNSRLALKTAILCVLVGSIALAGIRTITTIDDFSDASLRTFWTVDDDPCSYDAGGGFAKAAGHIRFNSVGNNAYAHIESTDTLDTTHGFRVDSIMRSDLYGTSTYNMGVSIYYNPNNWISLKIGSAGGQYGWMKQGLANGVMEYAMSNDSASCQWYWLIGGVEITDTQVKFYGSSIDPLVDHGEETDIDGSVSELTELAFARPAGFTGPATVIVGKGYTNPGVTYAPNPDFDNSLTSTSYGFAGLDYVRIQRAQFDPNHCGDTGTVYLEMDFNRDCTVDLDDLNEFAAYWLCTDVQDPCCQ